MKKKRSQFLLPGFGLTMGFSLFYLSLMVLLPLSALFFKTASGGFDHFFSSLFDARIFSAFRVSIFCALVAAVVNLFLGLLVAWTLVRYDFFGKKIINTLIDLPFALPTAVAGITLTSLYAADGPLGKILAHFGIQAVFNQLGIILALIFIGFPFVVRTVGPVLEGLEKDFEEAAACLGANRWKIFLHVILPEIKPSLLTGFALAFSRGLGEYGSVVFISGNLPFKTETIPLMIISKLEQYDYTGATAVATATLFLSFIILWIINRLGVLKQKGEV